MRAPPRFSGDQQSFARTLYVGTSHRYAICRHTLPHLSLYNCPSAPILSRDSIHRPKPLMFHTATDRFRYVAFICLLFKFFSGADPVPYTTLISFRLNPARHAGSAISSASADSSRQTLCASPSTIRGPFAWAHVTALTVRKLICALSCDSAGLRLRRDCI